MRALAQDFSQEQDFPERNLVREKPVFPHVVSCDEIAPRKILLLEKSLANEHTAGRHF
jgi:hypothetical protein